MSREEKVKKYTIELHLVEIEVDSDSVGEACMEYDEISTEIEPLECFDDYDEARDLFNDYVKELQ